MLIGIVAAQVSDASWLRGIKIELKPLVTRTVVVDLEAPSYLVAIVADLSVAPSASETSTARVRKEKIDSRRYLVAAHSLQSSRSAIRPLNDDRLYVWL